MNDIEIIVKAERDLYTDEEWAELLDDADTIVRCRDCKHFEEQELEVFGTCKLREHMWHFANVLDF